MNEIPSLSRYRRHLDATAQWLMRSIEHGRGGSAGYYAPLLGWAKPYPETSGYLIPTLLALGESAAAQKIGEWLIGIQHTDGSWPGGLYDPKKTAEPSVFNTGQIIKGMVALHCADKEEKWLSSAKRAADWLAADDRLNGQPSYFTHVAWPMLEVWTLTAQDSIRAAAERLLEMVLRRRLPNGAFEQWGFWPDRPAFTHTIAYTLRGFLESARLLNDWPRYGQPVEAALEILLRRAELSGGALSGALDQMWKADNRYSCLTGNAQLAICLLIWEQRQPDLRIVNAAAKLVDYVSDCQNLSHPLKGIRGAVGGSRPLWGRYMSMRYPNWAAKYHCDALLRLTARLRGECAS